MQRRNRLAVLGYLGLSAVDTALAGSQSPKVRKLRRVTKPLLMPALTASFLSATQGKRGTLRNGTAAAQMLSWGGDVALLGSSERAFLTGVGSFAGAHVAYIAAFLSVQDRSQADLDTVLRRPGPQVAAVAWSALGPVMAVAAGRKDPSLRLPVAVYSGIIVKMFATSTVLDRRLPAEARRKVVAGTSLFLLSDSILAVQKFLREHPSPTLESAVMATYTAGQWLISDGVAGLVDAAE